MNLTVSVVGVLGWCWVNFRKPTQIQAPEPVAWRECVLGVLGSRTYARMRSTSNAGIECRINLYATPEKPNTPNTLNTVDFKPLNLLSFECVGFVWGWLNVCWVRISEDWQ